MNYILEIPYLGRLEILEVYDAYDEPCLFAASNNVGHIFLLVLIDEDEDVKIWLCAPLSQCRFNYIRSGGIDLRDAFEKAEGGNCFIIKIDSSGARNPVVEEISVSMLAPSMLPLRGETISLQTETLPALSEKDLAAKAEASWREILRFFVEFPGSSRNEAPIKPWGLMLVSLQELIDSIGISIGRADIKGAFKKVLTPQTQFMATVPSAGSYAIDLVANSSADVLRESLAGKSLSILFELIQASHLEKEVASSLGIKSLEIQELDQIIKSLGRQSASKYKLFLSAIIDSKVEIRMEWRSPNPRIKGSASLSQADAISAYNLIDEMEITVPEVIEIHGVLVGANTETRRFELRGIYDDIKYKGDIHEGAFNGDTAMTLGGIYSARMEEKIEINTVTGEAKAKYLLLLLDQLHLSNAASTLE
jgi:hypothetical protein